MDHPVHQPLALAICDPLCSCQKHHRRAKAFRKIGTIFTSAAGCSLTQPGTSARNAGDKTAAASPRNKAPRTAARQKIALILASPPSAQRPEGDGPSPPSPVLPKLPELPRQCRNAFHDYPINILCITSATHSPLDAPRTTYIGRRRVNFFAPHARFANCLAYRPQAATVK